MASPFSSASLFSSVSSSSTATRPQSRGRRRERRERFSVFLATLAAGQTVASRWARPDQHLDAAVRALVPVRSARLTTRPVGGAAGPDGGGAGVLRFPVSTPARPGLHLEVTLDPACGLDSWDRQALRAAARVFGLMMLEPRREAVSGWGGAADGAAPIVGSSACMQHLRKQIERVAVTDFTVLIEGPIDRIQISAIRG